MKVLIFIFAIFNVSCHAGFLFAASGFYGGIGVDDVHKKYIAKDVYGDLNKKYLVKDVYGDLYKKYIKKDIYGNVYVPRKIEDEIESLAEIARSQHAIGEYKVRGVSEGKIAGVTQDDVKYVGLGSPYGFGGEKEIISKNVVLAKQTSSPFDGSQSYYSDLVDLGDRHAHQEVKAIKVIIDEDSLSGNNGHRGYGEFREHPEVQTIKVSYAKDENADHNDYIHHDVYNAFRGKHGGFAGRAPTEGKTIQVINVVEGGHSRHNAHGDYDTFRVYSGNGHGNFEHGNVFGGSVGNREVQTIKIIRDDGGTPGHGGFGNGGGYEWRGSHGGYGEFSGNGKVIH